MTHNNNKTQHNTTKDTTQHKTLQKTQNKTTQHNKTKTKTIHYSMIQVLNNATADQLGRRHKMDTDQEATEFFITKQAN